MLHLQPNTTLQGGKYRIERVLGQGGFGITYLATQVSSIRQVAIKELFIGGSGQAINDRRGNQVVVTNSANQQSFNQQKAKFKKEALRRANLNHPNLVKVHEFFEENGTAYYVMDYIEGESLRTKLNREGVLSEDLVLKYLQQLLPALETAHKQNIWHLDIKPENIMVDRYGHAYLIDFGASKHVEPNSTLTTSLALAYTPGYCPPELLDLSNETPEYYLQAIKDIGPWTDIYALGATIYNLLTDSIPPSKRRLDKEGRKAFSFPSNVSSSTRDLIVWMMKPNREDRPQSILEIRRRQKQIQKDNERTVVEESNTKTKSNNSFTQGHTSSTMVKTLAPHNSSIIGWIISAVVVFVGFLLLYNDKDRPQDESQNLGYSISSDGTIQFNISDDIHFNMKYVKAGTFNMGATPEITQFDKDERPVHEVTLTNDFYIGETEVTQALWTKIMGNNPSPYNKKGDNLPVNSVSWNDCQNFLKKLNSITGYTFRLPTEAEWEYAARGGNQSKKYMYSGSNNWGNVAWCGDNTQDTPGSLQKVKTLSPNELGIYDMSGNVSEWCQDRYGLYSSEKTTDPTGPASGDRRICRGGDIGLMPIGCTVSCRGYRLYPNERVPLVGIRLAASK